MTSYDITNCSRISLQYLSVINVAFRDKTVDANACPNHNWTMFCHIRVSNSLDLRYAGIQVCDCTPKIYCISQRIALSEVEARLINVTNERQYEHSAMHFKGASCLLKGVC